MALHPAFPSSPCAPLLPEQRWFPAAEDPHSGNFDLRFASFLEAAGDVQAFAKNYLAVGFKLDYVKANGDLANYHPDFIVRTTDCKVWLLETKGRAELDLPQKMARLKQWCADATAAESAEGGAPGRRYDFVYVDQPGFEEHRPATFAALARQLHRLPDLNMAVHFGFIPSLPIYTVFQL